MNRAAFSYLEIPFTVPSCKNSEWVLFKTHRKIRSDRTFEVDIIHNFILIISKVLENKFQIKELPLEITSFQFRIKNHFLISLMCSKRSWDKILNEWIANIKTVFRLAMRSRIRASRLGLACNDTFIPINICDIILFW